MLTETESYFSEFILSYCKHTILMKLAKMHENSLVRSSPGLISSFRLFSSDREAQALRTEAMGSKS